MEEKEREEESADGCWSVPKEGLLLVCTWKD